MDIKMTEKALKDYKRKKSIVETTLLRIETYTKAIEDPESFTHVLPSSKVSPGMPRGTNLSSPVEMAISDKEKAVELLNEWIKDDKSRIYPYQIELEQIDAALKALNKQERFIIECKYFEDMFWRDIEINLNDTFRQQNYITVEGIRKINRQAIEILSKILKFYYNRFKIKK